MSLEPLLVRANLGYWTVSEQKKHCYKIIESVWFMMNVGNPLRLAIAPVVPSDTIAL